MNATFGPPEAATTTSAAPAAFATPAAPAASATPAPPASAAALIPGWIGCRAVDITGADAGRIADVLFDARTRAPDWVLLSRGQHLVPAPARGLRHLAGGVRLACTLERIDTAPMSAAPPDGLTQRHALTLAAHFGVRCPAGPWEGVVAPSLTTR